MKYSLRQASEEDYQFLFALKVLCLKDYVATMFGWDEKYQRRIYSERFDPSTIQIIVVDGEDVGQLSVEKEDEELYIAGLYIFPQWQNQGLGSAVIEDVLSSAIDQGFSVRLQVLRVNPARWLYERLGFEVYEETESHFRMKTSG
jgi:ribosomal protein S18 acetylase RimI-like enzyme